MSNKLSFEDVYKDLEVKQRVQIADTIVDVPVKYRTQAIMGFFPISTKKAIKFINNSRLKPVEFYWGKSLLGITLFNHIVCPVGPYREIALSIPIIHDARIMLPFINILFSNLLKNFGFYSFLLTGSTNIGREHAEKIWGYPFYNRNIDVSLEENNSSFYILADDKEKQKKLFSMTVMKTKKEKMLKKNYQTYFLNNGNLIRVELNTVGTASYSLKRKFGKLELGNHEISDMLRDLSIERMPLETLYYTDAIKIANVPEKI